MTVVIMGGINNFEDKGLEKRYLTGVPTMVCGQCEVRFVLPKIKGPVDVHCIYCEALLFRLETENDWIEFLPSKVLKTRESKYTGEFTFD